MDKPNRVTISGFLLGVASVLIALLLFAGFFIAGQYSATCFSSSYGPQPNAAAVEKTISQVTDFYKCIISIQFAVIGVVLAVGYVYVHSISKQQARDIATEAMDSPSFQRDFDNRFKELGTKLEKSVKEQWYSWNSSEFEEIRASQKKLRQRVRFVEQVMDTYTSSDKKTGLTLQDPSAKDGG